MIDRNLHSDLGGVQHETESFQVLISEVLKMNLDVNAADQLGRSCNRVEG